MGRRTLKQRKGATEQELRTAAWDVDVGMLFSNMVMYFVILATAASLYKTGNRDVQSAVEAAQALRPLAGNAATALLALGLIGNGMLAVPILTGSAAYAVAEAPRWPAGHDQEIAPRQGLLCGDCGLDTHGHADRLRRDQSDSCALLDGGH